MMKYKRDTNIKNVYRLTPKALKKYSVGDRSKISAPLFWRNDVVKAWCITGHTGTDMSGDDFWIGIYDEDAPSYAGKFRFYFDSWGGMCGYNFNKFFDPSEIEYEQDLRIQEKFISVINELIREGIIKRNEKK